MQVLDQNHHFINDRIDMKWKNIKITIVLIALTLIVYLMINYFYPVKLTVIVPKNYQGEVILVLSNVEKDILTVDTNGIGYITKQTFDKKHSVPKVIEIDGTDVSSQCVGFSPSSFWAVGNSSYATEEGGSSKEVKVHFLSFEVVPIENKGEKQYYSADLMGLVDKSKLYKK